MSFGLLVLTAACSADRSTNPLTALHGKPDLIIKRITYTRLPNCYQGYPSGVICGGPRFEFELEIMNIGPGTLAEPFYISYSRSDVDFGDRYCSATLRVNEPPATLGSAGVLQVKFIGLIDDSTANALFVINTNDRFDRGVPLPMIAEASYDNNDYELAIRW